MTALGATAGGELVAASGGSDLALLSVIADSAKSHAMDGGTLRTVVATFMDTTSDVPRDGGLETHLVISDGVRTWEPDDLPAVITATAADPTWLQIQAAINNARGQNK